jgi:hypothetical protein
VGFDASEDREISNLKFLRARCNHYILVCKYNAQDFRRQELTIPNWLTYVANVAKLAPFRETFFKMESDTTRVYKRRSTILDHAQHTVTRNLGKNSIFANSRLCWQGETTNPEFVY